MDDLSTRRDPRAALHDAWSELVSRATGIPLDLARRYYVRVDAAPFGGFDLRISLRTDLEDVRDVIAALRTMPGEQTAQEAIAEAVGDGSAVGWRK